MRWAGGLNTGTWEETMNKPRSDPASTSCVTQPSFHADTVPQQLFFCTTSVVNACCPGEALLQEGGGLETWLCNTSPSGQVFLCSRVVSRNRARIGHMITLGTQFSREVPNMCSKLELRVFFGFPNFVPNPFETDMFPNHVLKVFCVSPGVLRSTPATRWQLLSNLSAVFGLMGMTDGAPANIGCRAGAIRIAPRITKQGRTQ